MTNRRVDAIYLVLIIAVGSIGYVAANRFSSEDVVSALPDYSPAPLVFDIPFEPFELPFRFVNFESAMPLSQALSTNMERALVEVRSTLLESSTLVEVRSDPGLLASAE